jgi:hypothetical protein
LFLSLYQCGCWFTSGPTKQAWSSQSHLAILYRKHHIHCYPCTQGAGSSQFLTCHSWTGYLSHIKSRLIGSISWSCRNCTFVAIERKFLQTLIMLMILPPMHLPIYYTPKYMCVCLYIYSYNMYSHTHTHIYNMQYILVTRFEPWFLWFQTNIFINQSPHDFIIWCVKI